ncbi:HNH endonuclease family protein [Mycolicibacterium goodii]|uniref:HNH endonuclease family protein n=1 Tax=Mycolicibacterium goodii TaxID=134601 RepID=UPI00256E9F6B|nr:HNH endonuclease family protein [Mycolicibacterium goodii]
MKRRYPAMVASIAAAMATGWMMLSPGDDPTVSASPAPVVSANISELLSKVTVVDAIPQVPGYERGCGIDKKTKFRESCTFGPAWNDPSSKSGCDTRNRVLAAQLHDVTFKPGTRDCKVTSGWVTDPYSGTIVQLNDIQIDHIVSLKRAYDSGAYQWPLPLRQQFANDTRNLLAVSGKINASKGSGALEDWMPEDPGARCPHVLRYLTVIGAYHLPITTSDRIAAQRNCHTENTPAPW